MTQNSLQEIHNLSKTGQAFIGGFPIFLGEPVAERWTIKTVAQLISPGPSLPEHRRCSRVDRPP